jgi:hypothetical protein
MTNFPAILACRYHTKEQILIYRRGRGEGDREGGRGRDREIEREIERERERVRESVCVGV